MEKFGYNMDSVLLINQKYFERIDLGEHTSALIIKHVRNFHMFKEIYERTKKPYFIYDKESFYKYYTNFDLEFYKKKYFSDSNMSDLDIMAFYHTRGVHIGHKPNRKQRILFYIAEYNEHCGGIVAIFNIADTINKISDKFYAEIVNTENNRTPNPICNSYACTFDNESIVVYPEVVTGNPLGLDKVVRWILLNLGAEMPFDHDKTFGPRDLVYEWTNSSSRILGKELRKVYVNPVYKNNLGVRNNTCYLIKKGPRFHKELCIMHQDNSILVQGSHDEVNLIFNNSKYFYCYDPKTMFMFYSMICGCIPIIYPFENMSRDEYSQKYLLGITKGFAYGDSEKQKKYAEETLKEGTVDILNKFEEDVKTIYSFLNDLEIFFNV